MEENKIQVLIVHGGVTFKSQEDYIDYLQNKTVSIDEKIRWSDDYLKKELGDSFSIIQPRMPLQDNAKYEEWKIYFERHIPLLKNNFILIDESLGGVFLAKYLSENKFPKKILSSYLIGPPFDNTLPEDDLVGGFELQSDLSMIEKNCENINLLFSKDDNCVPISHSDKYKSKLRNSNIIIYESKNGHFNIPEFPEIIEMIKADVMI